MTSGNAGLKRMLEGVDWRRAEFVLTGIGFLAFVTLGLRLTTIYSGLPAHPLFIHVPVVLIPACLIATPVFLRRPELFGRFGIPFCVVSIVAMSSMFPAIQTGSALKDALHLQGEAASLIAQHETAAHILAIAFTAFTAVLILTFAAERISGRWGPTGLEIADRLLTSRNNMLLLKVALVVLGLVSAYMVWRVGDLGAKAVWAGRLQSAASSLPPAGG